LRFLTVVGVLALAACSSQSDVTPIQLTHDACEPLALVSATATSQQLDGIQAAQALWRDRGVPALGLRAGATLEVRFESAATAFHGYYDDDEGVIYINTDLQNDSMLAIVIAHELGHAFGLTHVTDRVSLMNPGNLTTTPTAADQAELATLWGSCD
jgi:hypothetical protein